MRGSPRKRIVQERYGRRTITPWRLAEAQQRKSQDRRVCNEPLLCRFLMTSTHSVATLLVTLWPFYLLCLAVLALNLMAESSRKLSVSGLWGGLCHPFS
ncbi:hypothetical protein K437DRAFT_186068 [Tilletiaria anomala UBC 951]|uniref:Uncharacterized protein n=1 Tax=Tilletiaria anomala (strain ATCC 24038 / CBS 436.72 / UBC 951) TaxID=1037660 RepID=A0A066WEY0_TILAU|nr:uncharacterized protein K437DRAFT_186068 [Tilletiaria anomala UBC 951]KDN52512.1 hypothetical protein K437DRAFT_186068 [Tilletiaria anomala UBC 951]